ncbi:MAG: hypothetical protein JOZ42_16820, partial [Acetobacteraceae bacterium]|nr:hypothetical protein [Acetobacteraceae bacterium]
MRRVCAAFLLALLAATGAGAQTPDPTPYPQIETGMHLAAINRVARSPETGTIVTVSDDKTARLWSADGLKPLGVIRPPLGPKDDGALFAVTAWNKIVAVGGRIRDGAQFAVQFYRMPDLKLVGHLSNLPAPVSALCASRDGSTLAVGMVGGRGVAFFDLQHGGRQTGADPAYDGQVQWIDIAPDGRAVATGEDGRIRLYGPDHRRLSDALLPASGKPYAVAFAPDARSVAVADERSPTVWLLDAATLAVRGSLGGAPGRVGGFNVVAFAANGRSVFAGGTYKVPPNGVRLVRRWTLDSGAAAEIEIGTDTVTDIAPLDHGLVVSDA